MKKHDIYIPQDALETTVQLCSQELDQVYIKQSDSYMSILLRFLKMDLYFYTKVALIGLCCMMAIRVLIVQSNGLPFIIYFGMLGCMNVYESYKLRRFQMDELCTPVYLNQGRVFLFKNACMAIFEFMIGIVFFIIERYMMNVQVVSIMLSGLFPLLCIQILLLYLSEYIKHVFVSLSIYILLFMAYSFTYYTFEQYVLAQFNTIGALFLCIMTLMILFVEIWFLNIRRKGDSHGINITSYRKILQKKNSCK